ncbi:hypothetical protein [Naasia aerilata]|nr:hypothetical protein [Naasia aerilata]
MDDDLVDAAAPHCPQCQGPMDALVSAFWCLDCGQSAAIAA